MPVRLYNSEVVCSKISGFFWEIPANNILIKDAKLIRYTGRSAMDTLC